MKVQCAVSGLATGAAAWPDGVAAATDVPRFTDTLLTERLFEGRLTLIVPFWVADPSMSASGISICAVLLSEPPASIWAGAGFDLIVGASLGRFRRIVFGPVEAGSPFDPRAASREILEVCRLGSCAGLEAPAEGFAAGAAVGAPPESAMGLILIVLGPVGALAGAAVALGRGILEVSRFEPGLAAGAAAAGLRDTLWGFLRAVGLTPAGLARTGLGEMVAAGLGFACSLMVPGAGFGLADFGAPGATGVGLAGVVGLVGAGLSADSLIRAVSSRLGAGAGDAFFGAAGATTVRFRKSSFGGSGLSLPVVSAIVQLLSDCRHYIITWDIASTATFCIGFVTLP
jgi:hypothetical protein